MIVKCSLILLSLVLIKSALIAMDGQTIVGIDFKEMSRAALNEFAIQQDVLKLTPRSKQSLEARVKELNITKENGDFIYMALASDGSRPIMSQEHQDKFAAVTLYYATHNQMPPEGHP